MHGIKVLKFMPMSLGVTVFHEKNQVSVSISFLL